MTKTLLLTPTTFERELLTERFSDQSPKEWQIEICGFGLIESAIETARMLNDLRPKQIILCGIAGVYSPFRDRVGGAASFGQVAQYGVGRFDDNRVVSPAELGFGSDDLELTIALNHCEQANDTDLIVSVTTCNLFSEAEILQVFPNAIAEDMEAYSVAAVANKYDVPVKVIRGFSNVVGQPKRDWQIEPAMDSMVEMLAKD